MVLGDGFEACWGGGGGDKERMSVRARAARSLSAR